MANAVSCRGGADQSVKLGVAWQWWMRAALVLGLMGWTQVMAQQAPPANPQMPAAKPVPASSLPSIGTTPDAQPTATPLPANLPPTPQPVTPAPTVTAPPAPSAQPSIVPETTQPVVQGGVYVPAPQQVQMPAAAGVASLPAYPAYDPLPESESVGDELGSAYIPVDSPVYAMALRLYSMDFVDTLFLSERPWTRRVLLHALQRSGPEIMESDNEQAKGIYAALMDTLTAETPAKNFERGRVYGVESVYARTTGISGQILRDSFHLGQTFSNDYGRPYQSGFNAVAGFSTLNEWGRFSLYVRGEYQHAPSGAGYNFALAQLLSGIDEIGPYAAPNRPQATIPEGPIAAQNPFRLMEATLSFHVLGHEISGGKSDGWKGPAFGGSMGWSNNAENIYSFRIDRVEPLTIPLLHYITGPVRYDFYVGSLKGHTSPNSPWIHSESFAFRPTRNVEVSFLRTVIWGGKDHEPVTLHTFLRSFFSLNDTTAAEKGSAQDPGARYSVFTFSWKLPFLRDMVTLYTDSIAHDDVTPPSAPRRAAYRPGIYFSRLPHLPQMDFRAEAASTDTSTLRSVNGSFNYWEVIQRQGYTNKGFILGDWIGREAKGGNAWLTYHLSATDYVQLEYLNKKTPKDFIPGGTTQNQFRVEVMKHFRHDLELDAWFQAEHWNAPVYLPTPVWDKAVSFQMTWHPKLHTTPVASKLQR